MTLSPPLLVVGVDIAAASFEAAWRTSAERLPCPSRSYSQSPAGFTAFHQALLATGVAPAATLIVMEATSTYWVQLAVVLHDAGYQVAVVNPAKVHHYAQSLPRRGKSDALDTHMLCQFAAERRPEPWTPPPAVYHELRQRLLARESLLTMRQQVRNQLHALEQWPVKVASAHEHLMEVLEVLEQQLTALEQELEQVLADGAWAEAAGHLRSIPGFGLLTTAEVLVATVAFTSCASAEAAAMYAGLVPLEWLSGSSVKKRASIGHSGNQRLRTALYMASLSAAQHNPVVKRFYTRLREAGKPVKVARCAAARKLLHIAFALVSKGQDFDPSYQKLPSVIVPETEIAS